MTSADAAGRVLAARWQIERIRRPVAPGLVWLGYARPEVARFTCLACGDDGAKQGVLRAEGRTFFLCPTCASHQALEAPAPLSAFALRVALDVAGDPLPGAEAAARCLAGREGGVALDLGCAAGLVVDMIGRVPGWVATGVDPGVLPPLGVAALGAVLATGGPAEAVGQGAGPADVVRCEGVLGRVADPVAPLRALPALSRRNATWHIATADAARLYDSDDAGEILALAAPQVVLLPSEPGLRRLLRRSLVPDLATAPVERADGTLRVACRQRGAGDAGAVLDAYLARRLAEPPVDPILAGRLHLAALARHGADEWLIATLAPTLEAALAAAAGRAEQGTLAGLFGAAPPHAGALLLHAGLALRAAESARARSYLEAAAGLCQRAVALAPGPMRDQAPLAEAARAALAALPA